MTRKGHSQGPLAISKRLAVHWLRRKCTTREVGNRIPKYGEPCSLNGRGMSTRSQLSGRDLRRIIARVVGTLTLKHASSLIDVYRESSCRRPSSGRHLQALNGSGSATVHPSLRSSPRERSHCKQCRSMSQPPIFRHTARQSSHSTVQVIEQNIAALRCNLRRALS